MSDDGFVYLRTREQLCSQLAAVERERDEAIAGRLITAATGETHRMVRAELLEAAERERDEWRSRAVDGDHILQMRSAVMALGITTKERDEARAQLAELRGLARAACVGLDRGDPESWPEHDAMIAWLDAHPEET